MFLTRLGVNDFSSMRKNQYQLIYVQNRHLSDLEFERAGSRIYESFNVSEKKLLRVLYENLFEDESFPEDLNKYFEEAWDVSKNHDFPEIQSDEFDHLGSG